MDEERRPDEDTPRAAESADPIAWEHPEPAGELSSNRVTRSDPSDEAVRPPPRDPERVDHDLEPAPAVSLPPLEFPAIAPTFTDDATDTYAVEVHAIDIGDDEFASRLAGPVDALAPAAAPAGNGDTGLPVEDDDDTDDDLADDESSIPAAGNDDPRVGEDVDDEFDDEDEYDDEWDLKPATLRSTFFGTRAARFVTVIGVLTIAALLMSTVLLWQQVENVKSDVSTVPAKPVGNSELTDLRRRLTRLETQVAATTDDSGNLVGPTDELRAELASLRQCVATFQQALTSRTRTPIVIC